MSLAFAVGFPLAHVPPAATLVSWECGPGYHKPRFGRCTPDAGVPLYRVGRYGRVFGSQHAGRLPTPIRSMAPWGPQVHS